MLKSSQQHRCDWSLSDPLLREYHDKEWGVPIHHDAKLFEFLTLEGAQAGLNWLTILRKRTGYHKAFDSFDLEKISSYRQKKVNVLLQDSGIIRHKLKILSTIQNAKSALAVKDEFGSLDRYFWSFVKDAKPIKNKWNSMTQVPATSEESDALSKDLKKRGFRFVGSTICYAFMQATGMVNDHKVSCFRYSQV
ncbi:MAG: DNA-3-methyladenine glycosylase I [Nitrososphaerota archaeon]|nr:DNA-3-methyladenine glycosylase I [Nitrososphaerota archaeon]